MKLYRCNFDQKLYTIELLVLDIDHLNNNNFVGICAYPYNWEGRVVKFMNKDIDECISFVSQNFEVVAEIRKL